MIVNEIDWVPVLDKVVIAVETFTDMTASGIIIPETVRDTQRMTSGYVVAVGSKCELGIAVNDRVFFEEFKGSRLYLDGQDYLFVKEEAILAIVKDE